MNTSSVVATTTSSSVPVTSAVAALSVPAAAPPRGGALIASGAAAGSALAAAAAAPSFFTLIGSPSLRSLARVSARALIEAFHTPSCALLRGALGAATAPLSPTTARSSSAPIGASQRGSRGGGGSMALLVASGDARGAQDNTAPNEPPVGLGSTVRPVARSTASASCSPPPSGRKALPTSRSSSRAARRPRRPSASPASPMNPPASIPGRESLPPRVCPLVYISVMCSILVPVARLCSAVPSRRLASGATPSPARLLVKTTSRFGSAARRRGTGFGPKRSPCAPPGPPMAALAFSNLALKPAACTYLLICVCEKAIASLRRP